MPLTGVKSLKHTLIEAGRKTLQLYLIAVDAPEIATGIIAELQMRG